MYFIEELYPTLYQNFVTNTSCFIPPKTASGVKTCARLEEAGLKVVNALKSGRCDPCRRQEETLDILPQMHTLHR